SAFIQPLKLRRSTRLLCGARRLREERKGVTVRVYLAADLRFLIKELVGSGCEVRLMRHSSFLLAPGLLWRFLAFEDAEDLVTLLDSDAVNRSDDWLDQTERLRETRFMSYRRPRAYGAEIDANGYLVYRSVIAWPLGSRLRLPMGQLLRAFTWHARRGSFRT